MRGGTIAAVMGSEVLVRAKATRALSAVNVDGAGLPIIDDSFQMHPEPVAKDVERELTWRDEFGLEGQRGLKVRVRAEEDMAPTVSLVGLPREQVVLETKTLTFQVQTSDDFGVREVGITWKGLEVPQEGIAETTGERLLKSPGIGEQGLDLEATFTPKREGLMPQPRRVTSVRSRCFPGRERSYSREVLLYVLNPEQHARWLTQQLARWHQEALEVRDREQQLYAKNQELRDLPMDDLDKVETRRKIRAQAAAERANGRRLDGLTRSGASLLGQAIENPEFGAHDLEQWAKMLKALENIAKERMPSVADLLAKASEAPPGTMKPGEGKPSQSTPSSTPPKSAGKNRDGRSGETKPGEQPKSQPNNVPTISDVESGHEDIHPGKPKGSKPGRLTLPQTTVIGGGKKPDDSEEECPADEQMDQAVEEQKDLLAEFDKVAGALNELLGNLEDSTFVKRLKAAARQQVDIARRTNKRLVSGFGQKRLRGADKTKARDQVSNLHVESSKKVAVIQQDLASYHRKRGKPSHHQVLEEMRESNVVTRLENASAKVAANMTGTSIVQAEFWADTLDRWAEVLVGPGGT